MGTDNNTGVDLGTGEWSWMEVEKEKKAGATITA